MFEILLLLQGRKVYPRVDSFMQNSNLPFSKIAGIIWCWSKQMSNKNTEDLIGVSHKHIVNWFKVNHDVKILMHFGCSSLFQILFKPEEETLRSDSDYAILSLLFRNLEALLPGGCSRTPSSGNKVGTTTCGG